MTGDKIGIDLKTLHLRNQSRFFGMLGGIIKILHIDPGIGVDKISAGDGVARVLDALNAWVIHDHRLQIGIKAFLRLLGFRRCQGQ